MMMMSKKQTNSDNHAHTTTTTRTSIIYIQKTSIRNYDIQFITDQTQFDQCEACPNSQEEYQGEAFEATSVPVSTQHPALA